MASSSHASSSQQKRPPKEDALQDIFEDLMSRFIINVPESEIATTDRVCFQIEQAHWYYEDFLRGDDSSSALPGFTLKRFAAEMFQRCPLITDLVKNPRVDMEEIYKRFVAYKLNIPVCGAIILNEQLNKILLVRGWNCRSSWMFPKGKINQDETEVNCAIREVMEEIGYDITDLVREKDYIELMLRGEQRNRLYIIPNMSEETKFCPQTRKEIGDIKWHRLRDLPGYKQADGNVNNSNAKYFMVRAFMGELQKWLNRYKKSHKIKQQASQDTISTPAEISMSVSPQSHASILKGMLGISSSSVASTASTSSPRSAASSSSATHPSILGIYPPASNPSSTHNGSTGPLSSQGSTPHSQHPTASIPIPSSQHHASSLHSSTLHASSSLPAAGIASPVRTAPREIHHKASLLSILNSSSSSSNANSPSTSRNHNYHEHPSASAPFAPPLTPPNLLQHSTNPLQQPQQHRSPASIPQLTRQVSAPMESTRPDLLSILRGTSAAGSPLRHRPQFPPAAAGGGVAGAAAAAAAPFLSKQHAELGLHQNDRGRQLQTNKQSSQHLKQLLGLFPAASSSGGAADSDESVPMDGNDGDTTSNENRRMTPVPKGDKPRRRSATEPATDAMVSSNNNTTTTTSSRNGGNKTPAQSTSQSQSPQAPAYKDATAKKKRDKPRRSEECIFQIDSVNGRDSPANSGKGKKPASSERSRANTITQNGKPAPVDTKTPKKILKRGDSQQADGRQQQQQQQRQSQRQREPPPPQPTTPSSSGLPGQMSNIQLQDGSVEESASPMRDFRFHIPDLIGDKNWFVKD